MDKLYSMPTARRIYPFALGVCVGVAMCLGVMNFHVVRARDGFHLVQKQHAMLGQIYVDARRFSEDDWINHSELAAAMTADNKEYLMLGTTANPLQAGFNRIAGRTPKATR